MSRSTERELIIYERYEVNVFDGERIGFFQKCGILDSKEKVPSVLTMSIFLIMIARRWI